MANATLHRLVAVALSTLLVLAAGTGIAWLGWRDEVLAEGHRRNFFVPFGERMIANSRRERAAAARTGARRIVLFGDSTMMPLHASEPDRRTVPERIEARLAAVAPVALQAVAGIGLNPRHFYYLAPGILDQKPDLLLLPLHFRLLHDRGERSGHEGCALLPFRERLRAMRLPVQPGGLQAGQLLHCAWDTWGPGREVTAFADGLRARFRSAPFWGEEISLAMLLARIPPEEMKTRPNPYSVPITPDSPGVRLAREVVRVAEERGVPVLVFVNPIPYGFLAERGLYDRERYERLTGALRRAFDRPLVHFADLHRLVEPDAFKDAGGHLRAGGAERLAARLAAEVLAIWRSGHGPAERGIERR